MKLNKYLLLVALFVSSSVMAHGNKKPEDTNLMVNVDTEVGKTVAQLHTALISSDESTIKNIMAKDVLIFEGAGAERSLEEYASHHMKSDMKFLRSMDIELLERNIMVEGDIAISSSRSKIKGTYKGKEFEKISIETLVLSKREDGWKIVRVHWS